MIWNCHFHKQRKLIKTSSNAGLTLLESLVAISVIGITVASIGPVILISAASRVQSQRAEQALQLAQGEIDRVRQIVDQGTVQRTAGATPVEYAAADLLIASTPTAITRSVDALAPTAAAVDFDAANYQVARQIDINNDGTFDFAVQAYRLGDTERSVAGRPVAFEMGVRVYQNDAVTGGGTLGTESARLGPSGGIGDRDRRPLAVLYTEIVKSDERESLCEYFTYQTGSTPVALDCS